MLCHLTATALIKFETVPLQLADEEGEWVN